MDRKFSTRELAQMWNVSESTIKRWADADELGCERTPGGHRRFSLPHIRAFQTRRSFEATGVLAAPDWDDPDLELALNQRNFQKVRQQVFSLASRNQREQMRDVLKRLYLRGTSIAELYDHVLLPIVADAYKALEEKQLADGQVRLIGQNLEEAVASLFPMIPQRRTNGKMGLCATAERFRHLVVNAVSRVLEVEGWEFLNLGHSVPYCSMAEMVKIEPINLVCVVSTQNGLDGESGSDFSELAGVAASYRIPLLIYGDGFFKHPSRQDLSNYPCFQTFDALTHHVAGLARQ